MLGLEVNLGGTADQRRALGLIDEIGLFNVPLEQADIQLLMNDGLPSVLGQAAYMAHACLPAGTVDNGMGGDEVAIIR